jgi:hypothetical protein
MSRFALRQALLALLLCLAHSSLARAQLGTLLTTFQEPTGGEKSRFGSSLAAVGNNVLIGAPRSSTKGEEAGAAYLFDGAGKLLTTFHDPSPNDTDWFGYSVAAAGDNVVVSSLLKDEGGRDVGAAYVFDQTGALLSTITSPNPTGFDAFGQSIVAVGENILIGADRWRDSSGAFDSGIAYLFSPEGELLSTFENPTPQFGDHFGRSLAVVDDRVVIGAMGDSTKSYGSGAAYVYDLNGELLNTLHSPSGAVGDNFGVSVAGVGLSEILVGANLADGSGKDAGAVYRYDLNGNLVGVINNPSGKSGENFGLAIAALEDHVLIGADSVAKGTSPVGAAYLFSPSGSLVNTFANPAASRNDDFGFSLGVVGNSVLVGAPLEDAAARDSGAVYLLQGLKQPELVGDANLDGQVNLNDFHIMRENFGKAGTARQGDFDADGWVGLADLGSLKRNFGATRQTPGAAAVPEPSSLILAALAGIGACILGFRRLKS